MKQRWTLLAVLAGTAALATAQTAPQTQPNTQGQSNAPMTKPQADTGAAQQRAPVIPVTLDKSVDSKKVKAGDTIEAKTSVSLNSAKGEIPKGSKVIGHVTDAKSKGKGDAESSLTFAFDKIEVKKGQEIPFHAIAQAIAAPANNGPLSSAYPGEDQPPSAPTAGAPPAGHPGTAGTTSAPPASAAGNMGDTGASAQNGSPQLSQNSTGVIGIKGLNLSSQADSSRISSDSKSVKLDGGTQILLRVVQQ